MLSRMQLNHKFKRRYIYNLILVSNNRTYKIRLSFDNIGIPESLNTYI